MKNYEAIKRFFKENEDVFNETIEELDNYNGYLNDSRYYSMDMLDEMFAGCSLDDILNRAFFGHDEDTSYQDSVGNTIYGAFNPNRDYFSFNGYGNLISTDYIDYSSFLDDYFIDELIENVNDLYLDDDVLEMLEDIEK